MNYSEEKLKKIYNELPRDIQVAIFSIETGKLITAISKSFGLHLNQTGSIAEEAGYVMIGLTAPKDFKKKLGDKLPELNDKVITSITSQIDEQIFSKIRASMEEVHAGHKNKETPEEHKNEEVSTSLPDNDTDKIFEERMSKLFNIPQKKVEEEPKKEVFPKYKRQDPYREPIE